MAFAHPYLQMSYQLFTKSVDLQCHAINEMALFGT
jgi:hypothetical protein